MAPRARRHLPCSDTRVAKRIRLLVYQHFGLVAASEALRHSNISTTFNHYVENKQRSVLGFGHLLAKIARTIIPIERPA